ncbi:alcohol dehydrogenase catalytic domain-containing protein [Flavobacteriaceae bacterium]|nr:alcohol dehydrogenase catalytic domain-containing protein [Flavobacteriaceae bacterium]MDB4005899.1 alcohol dehydrogenase catalytic domain-containing protein [Flavobacteriaceae bacterium]
MKVNALAVNQPNEKLKPFTYELGELGSEDIDVKVLYCGICHSDMSMMNNE